MEPPGVDSWEGLEMGVPDGFSNGLGLSLGFQGQLKFPHL